MKYTPEAWTEKRKGGLVRYLLVDGILFTGGPYAVVMQVIQCFLALNEGQTIGQYFTASRTWITFFALATLFGLIMGFINWWRNEKAFSSTEKNA